MSCGNQEWIKRFIKWVKPETWQVQKAFNTNYRHSTMGSKHLIGSIWTKLFCINKFAIFTEFASNGSNTRRLLLDGYCSGKKVNHKWNKQTSRKVLIGAKIEIIPTATQNKQVDGVTLGWHHFSHSRTQKNGKTNRSNSVPAGCHRVPICLC